MSIRQAVEFHDSLLLQLQLSSIYYTFKGLSSQRVRKLNTLIVWENIIGTTKIQKNYGVIQLFIFPI